MKRILIATVTFAMLAASVGLGATPKVQLLIHGKLRGVDDVVPLSNRDVVRSGEEIRFELVCDQRAYVYLLALGSSGRISILQPFSGRTDDALQEAGVARSLPSTAEFLPLDETPGKEILYAFASEEPLPNLSRFVARLESLKRDTEVQETLRGEFPELVALELQHLPGPMSLRPFQPDVTPTPASVLGVEQRGLTSATGTEEPGVLSNQGGVIRSLIGNAPSAALGRGLPLQIPDRTKTEVDRKRSTGSHSNRGSQRGAETGGASNPPAPPKDSDSWWKRLGSVFTANRSAPGPRASASVPTRLGAESAPIARSDAGQPIPSGRPISTELARPDLDLDAVGASVVLVVTGTGSFATGVIVSDGLVLTSRHMVADQTELSVLPRGHGDVANLSSRHLARVVRQNVWV